MRRVLALGCCALSLALGFVAGLAHVHESAGHHEEARGLHLDHGHLGESSDHDRHLGHEHHSGPSTVDRAAGIAARHVDHHHGDAFYLSLTAARSVDPSVRPLPASVSVSTALDPPSTASGRVRTATEQLRDPPPKNPPRPRGPPA